VECRRSLSWVALAGALALASLLKKAKPSRSQGGDKRVQFLSGVVVGVSALQPVEAGIDQVGSDGEVAKRSA
jgi:hypothetical protein